MIECKIRCQVPAEQFEEIQQAIIRFSEAAEAYGFLAGISHPDGMCASDALVTLAVDDEKIEAMKGAKRGPKEKPAQIPIEEMLVLKQAGHTPKEIAALAGISTATYFRRMAACKAAPSRDAAGEEGKA